ncbi:MAG: excinuclease ABC subunit UvrA, partial [Parcubacteria group bacterium]|nr:excinuclease ABC subunit UvrA [Parcubacteria group bacterium]
MTDYINIKGARVHNLKNIDIKIPKNKLVVITGLSGSGKSSLAFDTIYAEGQRRYVESLSSYARQFLGVMEKPDVDKIEGLSPAISIDQKSVTKNPRSTVGTITEIYDYMRLLFARIGQPHCPECEQKIQKQTINQILNQILEIKKGTKINLFSPIIQDKKGEHKHVLEEIRKASYARVRVDGKIYPIEEAEDLDLDKKKKHSIDVVVDRLVIEKGIKSRLADSLETALDLGNGVIVVYLLDEDKEILFSELFACPTCKISFRELNPRNFSFNSPHGACPECQGLGNRLRVDPDLIIPNKRLTVAEGAIRPWSSSTGRQTWYYRILEAVADENNFSLNTPVKDLKDKDLDKILHGTGSKVYMVENFSGSGKVSSFRTSFEGIVKNLERRYKATDSDYIRTEIEKYMRIEKCPGCHGQRLSPQALAVKVMDKSISEVNALSVEKSYEFFSELDKKNNLNKTELKIAEQIIKEICERVNFLKNVGLEYITLDRSSATLSGGESQRIRLA